MRLRKSRLLNLIGGALLSAVLCLAGEDKVLAAESVEITETNFPDVNFRQWVSETCDSDKNGILAETEIDAVTEIVVTEKGIKDLTGVQYFSGVQYLHCEDNQLTSLDVSSLSNLKQLYCSRNQLTGLDVSNQTNLTSLICFGNQLTSLDVSGLSNLKILWCYDNQLTSLDVSSLSKLESLNCFSNQLTVLDVSNLKNLETLYCQYNQLTGLDVSGLSNLQTVWCHNNQLTSLNVSGLTNLQELHCHENKLTSLDVSQSTNLSSFESKGNTVSIADRQLDMTQYDQNFDMSKVSNLKDIVLNENIFTILDGHMSGTYDYDCGNGHNMTVTITTTTEGDPGEDDPGKDDPGAIFSDVPADAWYADAVKWANSEGVMNGVGNNNFNPMGSTTRAMVVQILYNITGTPAVNETRDFTDVTPGAWYVNAVQWAATTGVTSGVSATEFAPERDVTRQEVAVFLYQYAKRQGRDTSGRNDLSGFSDSNEVASWAMEAMQWANYSGIINGKGTVDPKLDPQGTATRAEIATMMRGFMTQNG